jgi:hypothetical protein
MSASAQRIRRGFLRDRSHFTPETIFEPELSFCEALFNYVRLTASPFVTARLAEDYSFNGEEPEEVHSGPKLVTNERKLVLMLY